MPGGRPRLLLGLAGAGRGSPTPRPVNRRVSTRPPSSRPVDQVDEPGEVRLPFARAEVDAEPRPVDPVPSNRPRVPDGLRRGGQRDLRIPAVALPSGRVAAE